MKRLTVFAALMFAACGSQKPAESSLPPGYVTLATFTADVDTAAGTFVFRTDPVTSNGASGPGHMAFVEPTEVTVASSAAWSNVSTEKGCGLVPTWGASVTVTNKIASPTSIGGVYAEITAFAGPAGTTACNAVANTARPAGMSNSLGLWTYGTLLPATGAASVSWAFNYTSGAKFSFSGRIVGVKVTSYAALPPSTRTAGNMAPYGSYMVYGAPSGTTATIVYANASTGVLDSQVTVPSNVLTGVAGDATNSRVWFLSESSSTGPGYVGVVADPGHVVSSATDDNAAPFNVIIDPRDKTLAWFINQAVAPAGYIRSARYTPGSPGTIALSPTKTSLASYPQYMAMGLNNNLYVANGASGITEYTTSAVTGVATWSKDYPSGVNCNGAAALMWVPSTSTLWVAANTSGYVCSVTISGTGGTATWTAVAPMPSGSFNVRDLAWAPSGRAAPHDYAVWAANLANNTVMRVDPDSSVGYTITMPVASGAFMGPQEIALSTIGEIWTSNNARIFRMVP